MRQIFGYSFILVVFLNFNLVSATEIKYKPDQEILLSWNQLMKLPFQERHNYIVRIREIFSQLDKFSDVALGDKKTFFDIFLESANATPGNIACFNAGWIQNAVPKVADQPNGPKTCNKPASPISFCGTEYKCDNVEDIPCNPLIFGFKNSNFPSNATLRQSDRKQLIAYTCTRAPADKCTDFAIVISQGGTTQERPAYKELHCIPKSQQNNATSECKKLADANTGFNLARMLLDFSELTKPGTDNKPTENRWCTFGPDGKNLAEYWNTYVSAIKGACAGTRAQTSECRAVLSQAQQLSRLEMERHLSEGNIIQSQRDLLKRFNAPVRATN